MQGGTVEQEARFGELVAEGLDLAGVADEAGLSGRLARYCAMVRRFRRAAGLTAEKDDRRMTRKMAIEPLLALDFLPEGPVLDVGSGAGSPGISLAAARSDLRVTMLEPDRRKSVFIGEAVRALALDNAVVERLRLEDLLRHPANREAWPTVASRAAMKPAAITRLVGESMPGTERLVLFLSTEGVEEAGSGPFFRLDDQRPLPWRPSSRVALFLRNDG
jgi:16S rRNA (guanine527-N7)-methyltransferase